MFRFLLVLMLGVGISGQAGAQLSGVVLDPSGSVVTSATVTVSNLKDSSSSRTAISDAEGKYAFMDLPPGHYRMVVFAPGFKEYINSDVHVIAGAGQALAVRLELSPISQTLTVTTTRQEGYAHTETDHGTEILEIHEVRESSAKDVGEALVGMEGLYKIRKSGIANDIVLRGFQQDNLNVLIDRAHVFGACPNNMDPAAFHVDFSEVEKVEVTRGPFDMRTEGGLGGAINIVNKEPKSGFHLTPNLAAGSFGYFNPSLTASGSKGRFFGLIGHSFRRSDPYQDGSGKRMTEYANYLTDALDSEAYRVHTSWLKLGAELAPNQKIDVGYTRQRTGQVLYPYLQMDGIYDDADRANLTYNATSPFAHVSHLRLQGYFTQVSHWMTDQFRVSSDGSPRPYSMGTFAGTRALGMNAEAEIAGFITGADVYSRDWDAGTSLRPAGYMTQASVPDVRMNVAGFYVEHIRQLHPSLRLTAGARLDTSEAEARSSNVNTALYLAYKGVGLTPRRDTAPSGSLRLAYTVRNLDVFAGVGHRTRFADPQERFFALKRMGSDWVGNPDLDLTRNTEVDLGFTLRTNRFIVRPTFFYSNLDDFVVVHNQKKMNAVSGVMNSMARSYFATDARIYGGEVMSSATLTDYLIFRSGFSYSRGSKDIAPAFMITDPDLPETAPYRLRALLRYGQKMFFGELEGVFLGRQDRVDSDLKEMPTPGYAVVNLKIGIHGEKLKFSGGVDNLLNRYYREHFSFQRDPYRTGAQAPEPGRSAFLTLGYEF